MEKIENLENHFSNLTIRKNENSEKNVSDKINSKKIIIKKHSIKINSEIVNPEEVNPEPVIQEEVNPEPVIQEEVNSEPVIQEEISIEEKINKIFSFILSKNNSNIILLKEKTVLQWIFGDLAFLPKIDAKTKKEEYNFLKKVEDNWGKKMLKKKRPDLKPKSNWTNLFGEYIANELFLILEKPCQRPELKEHLKPDFENDENIIEIKTQTYYTNGTAGEKILGTPFKYAEIPILYQKPLNIICIGGIEKISREKFGNIGNEISENKKKILNCFNEIGIKYIGITDLFNLII